MSKLQRLNELARLRQQSRWDGYECIGDYHNGVYECDFVSPYTRGACNVDAKLMVLLQDWASDDVLKGAIVPDRLNLGHDPTRRTNIQLKHLLKEYFQLELEDIYATNVFPFIKKGEMNSPIKPKDLKRAAEEFALPQMRIVAPRLAVCLGESAFNAIAEASGRPPSKNIEEAIDSSPFRVGATWVWCQSHTSQQGTNNRNRKGRDTVSNDWARMAKAYQELQE